MAEGRSHRPRKRFGQNFLTDERIVDRILGAVGPATGDNLVEIGPGQGALTGRLLAASGRLQAVEVDRDLARQLQAQFGDRPGFELICGDALTLDFAPLAASGPLRIVGNLPYNISTPLLFHLLQYAPAIQDMHFMLQKEVVDRLGAAPGGKDYGRLSVIIQYYCAVQPLFGVPPGAFRPAPKVDSAVVRLVPLRQPPVGARDPDFFRRLVSTAFQQRRKTLRNSLKPLGIRLDAEAISIDLSLRPEALTVSDFVQLSNELDSQDDPPA